MKKAIIPILILLGVTVWSLWPDPVPVGAGTLDLSALTDTQVINAIKTAESKAPSYFPIVVTHDSPPSTATSGDYLRRPQNRGDGFTQNMYETMSLKNMTGAIPFSIEVRTCESGTTMGYTIYLEKLVSGVRWQRIEGVGTCAETSIPWTESPLGL